MGWLPPQTTVTCRKPHDLHTKSLRQLRALKRTVAGAAVLCARSEHAERVNRPRRPERGPLAAPHDKTLVLHLLKLTRVALRRGFGTHPAHVTRNVACSSRICTNPLRGVDPSRSATAVGSALVQGVPHQHTGQLVACDPQRLNEDATPPWRGRSAAALTSHLWWSQWWCFCTTCGHLSESVRSSRMQGNRPGSGAVAGPRRPCEALVLCAMGQQAGQRFSVCCRTVSARTQHHKY